MASLTGYSRRTMPLFVIALFAIGPAIAQSDLCKKTENKYLQGCSKFTLQRADQDLSNAFALAIESMRQADLAQVEHLRGYEDALRTAQKAWMTFRDAECRLATFESRGGSGAGHIGVACTVEMTETRTNFLKSVARNYKPAQLRQAKPQ